MRADLRVLQGISPLTLPVAEIASNGTIVVLLGDLPVRCNPSAVAIPVRRQGSRAPRLQFVPGFTPQLSSGDPVVCYPGYLDGNIIDLAYAWTPYRYWEDARSDYVVVRDTIAKRKRIVSDNVDNVAGMWGLSLRWATSTWRNGIIHQRPGVAWRIMRVTLQGLEPLDHDPRIPQHHLPAHLRALSKIV